MGIAFFWAASRQLDMLGLNTIIHKEIREDVCQYMSNLDEDNKKELEESILGRDLEDYLQKNCHRVLQQHDGQSNDENN